MTSPRIDDYEPHRPVIHADQVYDPGTGSRGRSSRRTAANLTTVSGLRYGSTKRAAELYRTISSSSTPCQQDVELYDTAAEGSKHSFARAQVVILCASCPVLAECRQLAQETRPTFGIWAGQHSRDMHSRDVP